MATVSDLETILGVKTPLPPAQLSVEQPPSKTEIKSSGVFSGLFSEIPTYLKDTVGTAKDALTEYYVTGKKVATAKLFSNLPTLNPANSANNAKIIAVNKSTTAKKVKTNGAETGYGKYLLLGGAVVIIALLLKKGE